MQKGVPSSTSQHALIQRLFKELAGTWLLDRRLQSANASEPSGRCKGKATFTETQPSPVMDADGKLQLAGAELLYREQGEFEMDTPAPVLNTNVPKFSFSRQYIWRLQQSEGIDTINIWFTKPGTDQIDYLFHKINMVLDDNDGSDSDRAIVLRGQGGHLCVDDYYSSSYVFEMSGIDPTTVRLSSWSMMHEVRGPKKDQIIETTFNRT
jgi:hypothetical protein